MSLTLFLKAKLIGNKLTVDVKCKLKFQSVSVGRVMTAWALRPFADFLNKKQADVLYVSESSAVVVLPVVRETAELKE